MKNNRTKPRFDVSLTARFYGTAAHREIRISDLSEGGCYVDSISEVTLGESLVIRILVSEGEWLELKIVVAHLSRNLGFGARFVNLDEESRSRILSLIQRATSNVEQDPKGSWRLGELDCSAEDLEELDNFLAATEVPAGDPFFHQEPIKIEMDPLTRETGRRQIRTLPNLAT